VSHKTEYGHFDPARVNLRDAALSWMRQQGFFRQDGFGLPIENVRFAATRSEKIEQIARLGFTHFIDDLPEGPGRRGVSRGRRKDPFHQRRTRLLLPSRRLRALARHRGRGAVLTVAATPGDVVGIGSALVGWRVRSATPVRRGGNNRIFLLTGDDARAALKFYPNKPRIRATGSPREFAALSFLRRHGVEDLAAAARLRSGRPLRRLCVDRRRPTGSDRRRRRRRIGRFSHRVCNAYASATGRRR